jgi:hypothetical protein
MGKIDTKKPKPNMNNEHYISVHPLDNQQFSLWDLSHILEPYNGWQRDKLISEANHEIHGKILTVYIRDTQQMLTRKQAINLAGRFINGDYSTYRLD